MRRDDLGPAFELETREEAPGRPEWVDLALELAAVFAIGCAVAAALVLLAPA